MEIKKDEIEKCLTEGYTIRAEMKFIAEKENRLMPIYNVGDLYEDKGVVAAVTFENGKVKVLVLALKDTFEEEKNWDEAMKHFEGSEWKLPTKEECGLIIANIDKVQKVLKEYGKEMNGWYWSSSEYTTGSAWVLCTGSASWGGLGAYDKGNNYYVRPVLALSI